MKIQDRFDKRSLLIQRRLPNIKPRQSISSHDTLAILTTYISNETILT